MFKFATAALIAATSLAALPTTAERAAVPVWEASMKHWGYEESYEIHQADTVDGWELNVFRIIPKTQAGKDKQASLKQSILWIHGGTMDATSWFTGLIATPGSASTLPAPMALAEKGYDVWMGSNRGTKYCSVNTNYPNAEDP